MRNLNFLQKISFLYLAVVAVTMLMLSWIYFPRLNQMNTDEILKSPSAQFIFGTDSLGRDFLLRWAWGGVLTLGLTFLTTLSSLALGGVLGFFSGWSSRWFGKSLFRLMDLVQSVPSLVLAALIYFFLQNFLSLLSSEASSLISMYACLVLTQWVNPARMIRSEVQKIRHEPYIEASRSLGANTYEILVDHVLPSLKSTLFLIFGLQLPAHIFFESFLSFIGFGFQPPLSSWGTLIHEGWGQLSISPHLSFIPLFFVVSTVWAVNNLFGAWTFQADGEIL